MDYLTKLVEYYEDNFDKAVKGISSHSEFTIEDAEDVVQDGMVKALVAINNDYTLEDIEVFFMRHVTQARINHYNRYIMEKSNSTEEEEVVEDAEDFMENFSHFNLTPAQARVIELKSRGYVDSELGDLFNLSRQAITKFFKELTMKAKVGGKIGSLSGI